MIAGCGEYKTEGMFAEWSDRFKKLDAKIFEKVKNYYVDVGKFPKPAEAMAEYKRIERDRMLKRRPAQLSQAPAIIKEMSPEEVDREFECLPTFYEAYPHPATGKESEDEALKMDKDYAALMRKHGIDPDAPLHPKVIMKLFKVDKNMQKITDEKTIAKINTQNQT